jgi:hypothetical protein
MNHEPFNNNVANEPTNSLNQIQNHLFQQTIIKTEHIAKTYAEKIIQEKNKLDRTRSNHKNTMSLETILNIINQREINMVYRAQNQIHYQIRRLLQ